MVLRFKIEPVGKTALKNIIDRQSVAANQEKKKVRSSMYASDVGACMRKVWFDFFPEKYGTDKEIEPRLARIFENGNAVHERLGGYLKREESIDFRDELNVPRNELDVHGRCDGICTVGGVGIVVEFKSINKEEMDGPKEEHVDQLTWYLGMFGTLRDELFEDFGFEKDSVLVEEDFIGQQSASGRTLDTLTPTEKWLLLTQGLKGELIYESKRTNETYHYSVDFDPARFRKVGLFFEQLKWHVDIVLLPNVKYRPSAFPCAWGKPGTGSRCAYFDLCYPPEK
jgi:hypothetical protein